ncbi:GIY-YIG nuclease family protein, partial [Carboxylicivirga caseinilyticus]|nr:GIY-YIG nuclease family protein [Marinilabiliaceae bacterium A049]
MVKYHVYIIYSEKFDRFFIGQTQNLKLRIEQHNSGFFSNSSTKFTNDWV